MKILLVISLQFFILLCCQAQKSVPSDRYTGNEYLQKSRTNKNTGIILLSVGLLAVGAGAAWISSSDFLDSDWDNGPYITTTIGIGFTVASIPIFIISGSQGRRGVAASMHFSVQDCNKRNIKQFASGSYPALLMKYNF